MTNKSIKRSSLTIRPHRMHRVQIDAACWYTRSVACVSVCCMQPWAVLKRLNRSRSRLGVDCAGNNESRCRKRDNFEGTFCLHTTQSSQIVPNNWQSSELIQSRFNCNIIQCNRNRNAHRVNSIYSTSVAHVHKISWLYYQSVCHAAYYIITLINTSELCALSTSVWDCLMSTWLDVFSERLQCSPVSEPVTSLMGLLQLRYEHDSTTILDCISSLLCQLFGTIWLLCVVR